MTTSKFFNPKNKQILKITVDEREFLLEIKLDAREYFYPYLLFDPERDYSYFERYGMSKETYKKHKKISKMLRDKKYEDLFRDKFKKNLEDFLRKLEYEVRIHYEDGESLEQKVSENEDIIFKLIEKEGPSVFRHNAVLDKIKHWSNAKDSSNIENLSMALKEYGKISKSYISFNDFEKRVVIIFNYPDLRERIREFKKDITLKKKIYGDYKSLYEAVISEWKEKGQEGVVAKLQWFEELLKLAKKEKIDFISFITDFRGILTVIEI